MLSFTFMIVCGRICVYFCYCLIIYVLLLEMQLPKAEGCDLINWLIPARFLFLFESRTRISNAIFRNLFFLRSNVLDERWLFVLLILVELLTITA
jgi:hypothetical protein